MRGPRLAGSAVVAALVIGLSAACGSSFSSDSNGDSGADGSSSGGGDATADHTGDGTTPKGDGGGSIVYVSPTGSDMATGLDPAHPRQTIASGLSLAATLPSVAEVHVCKGSYSETNLAVTTDVLLLGGYDCAFVSRDSTKNVVTVGNKSPSSQSGTLVVGGSSGSVTSATKIDGFTFSGAPSGTSGASYGIDLRGSASPVISDDVIEGGGGTATGTDAWGSIGVHVAGTSSAEITACLIDGGSGKGPSGSAGIAIEDSATPSVHSDIIAGGSGTGSQGDHLSAAGISVNASLPVAKPIYEVFVQGSSSAIAGATDGIRVANGASVSIVGSVVSGGASSSSTTNGIYVQSGGAIAINADRVFGGTCAPGLQEGAIGVRVELATGLSIVNSEIHAGVTGGGFAVGVDLFSVAGPQIEDDTIYIGDGEGTAVAVNGPADGGVGVTGALINGDLLLGSNSSLSNGVAATSCTGMIAQIDNTGFTSVANIYTCGGGLNVSGVLALAMACASATACHNDVQIGGTGVSVEACSTGTDNNCVIPEPDCPGPPTTCLGSIFGSWPDDGEGIVDPTTTADGGTSFADWAVAPSFVTQSPQPTTLVVCGGSGISGVATDLLGNVRATSGKTSMGAVVTVNPACPQ